MKNNKNKKKIATIIALVASFVLCIGASFGITMAYFGGKSEGIRSITLKTGVSVGAEVTSSATTSNHLVVPGQPISINATATVSAYQAEGEVVPGLLRAKFTSGGTATGAADTDIVVTLTTTVNETNLVWVYDGSEYYYLCTAAPAENAEYTTAQLYKVTPTTEAAVEVVLQGACIVPTGFGNEDSGKTFIASVVFEVAQAELYSGSDLLADTELTIGNETVQAAFTQIAG